LTDHPVHPEVPRAVPTAEALNQEVLIQVLPAPAAPAAPQDLHQDLHHQDLHRLAHQVVAAEEALREEDANQFKTNILILLIHSKSGVQGKSYKIYKIL
jgi:hypothetical protein